MLLDLQPAGDRQATFDLDEDVFEADACKQLMGTLDAVNERYGRGALKHASTRIVQDSAVREAWEMKQQRVGTLCFWATDPPRAGYRAGPFRRIPAPVLPSVFCPHQKARARNLAEPD